MDILQCWFPKATITCGRESYAILVDCTLESWSVRSCVGMNALGFERLPSIRLSPITLESVPSSTKPFLSDVWPLTFEVTYG